MDGDGSMGWGDDRRMSTSKSRWAAVQIRSQELPSLVPATKGHAASGASALRKNRVNLNTTECRGTSMNDAANRVVSI